MHILKANLCNLYVHCIKKRHCMHKHPCVPLHELTYLHGFHMHVKKKKMSWIHIFHH